MKPHKAIVLAAGLGTRLRPLTCATPKPLMPIWGVPMVERVVDQLVALGVDEVVLNGHYLVDSLARWVAAYQKDHPSLKLQISRESEILGTGGVLNPLRAWIGEEPFYLVNGDIVFEGWSGFIGANSFEAISTAWGRVLGLCLVSEEGPRTIEVEPDSSFVTCWKSPDPGWNGTFTYCGIALLSAEILKYVEPTGFSTIVQAYERAATAGGFIRAVTSEDLVWTDAGTIDSYLALNRAGDENAYAALPQIQAACAALSDSPDAMRPVVSFEGARGSNRCFFRLTLGTVRAMVIVYDDEARAENAKYASAAQWLLSHGISVPKVLADLSAEKTLVLEDVGSVDLRQRVAGMGPHAIESYVPVVEALVKFNALGAAALEAGPARPLEPAFGPELWADERRLFVEHCLASRFGLACPPAVEAELETVARVLEAEPRALVHRDFQSTNVMWRGDKFSFIDFQGMRLGPAVYDLASLLYDPYVTLTEGERRALAALYGKKCGRPEITRALPYAAVERLIQALGAYGRLASVGQTSFTRYIEPALVNLLAVADEANLEAIGALAEDLIARVRRASPTSASASGTCSCHHEAHVQGACSCGHSSHEGTVR